MASYTRRIELELSPGVWTANPDVTVADGIMWRRGVDGRGPTDCVAAPGTLSFSLNNGSNNSGGVAGYYSPGHASVRSGFATGIGVRVIYTYNATDYTRWTGTLSHIEPTPGLFNRRTRCTAVSTMASLVDEKVRAIEPQLDRTEVELLDAVLDAIPTAAQPAATDFDPAIDSFPFACDDLKAGTGALGVIVDLMQSARGHYFETGDGTHRYQSQARRAVQVSQFTFTGAHLKAGTGVIRPTTLDSVYNRVRVTTHAKAIGATDTDVLARHAGKLAIPAGETLEHWLDYRDPNTNDYMGGTDFQDPPVATTDYEFNDAENGSGADVTGDITIAASFFASSAKLVIENTGAATAYAQLLQVRGRTIKDVTPVVSEASVAQGYGVRTIEIDERYQDDAIRGRDDAEYIASNYNDLGNQIDSIEFDANHDSDTMTQALSLEIGDVVTVNEATTGTVDVDGYVQAIEVTEKPGPWMTVRLFLAPRIEQQIDAAEDLEIDDVLTQTSPAPSTLVDVATVDFSEAA